MKRHLRTIMIAAAMVLGLSACEGFLDTVPTDSVVDKNAMVTLPDAKVACNGLYTKFKYYTLYGTYIPYMGDLRADNMYPRTSDGTGAVIYTWQYESSANSYFGTFWNNYYNIIMRCNTFLENIENLEVTSTEDIEEKEDYIGQAYVIRALAYFDIARLYGQPYTYDNGASLGAVIVNTTISSSEALEASRTTVAETYNQILNDIDKGLPLLTKSKNLGHFNYWAAKLFQARVYLYMGKYSEAYTAATEVINNSPYELVPRDEYLDSWGWEGNDESVMEFLVSINGDIDDDGGFYTMYHNMWFDDSNCGASLIPTLKWRNLFKDTPDDIRAQMIKYDDPVTGFKKTGEYWLKKFIGNKDQGYTFRRNNPHAFRLSEAYLIAAEAGLESGHATEASNYLNAFRAERYENPGKVTATQAIIEVERQKEFIGEGHRFFDVMRRGGKFVRDMNADPHDFGGGSAYQSTLKPGDTKVVLPISSDERVTCPNIQQNPGYKD